MKISLTCYNNKSLIKKQTNNNNTKSSVPFKAKAWKLPNVEINNSYDAMTMYNYLKVGNYLDSSDDDVSFDSRRIRENNFSFLDKLKTPEEKKEFIEYYKEVTGFPDLEKVSKNIEREFILGIKKSSIGINGGNVLLLDMMKHVQLAKKELSQEVI